MKGFTKGKGKGRKFIPTTNKKQALSRSDIGKRELTVRKYVPIDERKKQSIDKEEISYSEWMKLDHDARHKLWESNSENYWKHSHREQKEFAEKQPVEYIELPDGRMTKGISGRDLGFATFNDLPLQSGYAFRDGLIESTPENPYSDYFTGRIKVGIVYDPNGKNHASGDEMEIIDADTIVLTNKDWDEKNQRSGGNEGSHPHYLIYSDEDELSDYSGRRIDVDELEIYKNPDDEWDITTDTYQGLQIQLKDPHPELQEGQRAKQHLGHFGDKEIDREDDGTLSDHLKDHPKDIHRFKFSLLGEKSPEEQKLEAKEDKINQNNKLAKETEKVQEKQAKADEKTGKALRKTDEQKLKSDERSIRFLEKQIKGLQEKPAKFGVNAQSQLDVIEQAREDLTNLQSETDEIRSRLNEV